MFQFILICVLSFTHLLVGSEQPEAEKTAKVDPSVEKISEAFGHLIGKNIDTLGVKFDLEYVIKGLQDSINGKSSPLSETECIQAISASQEESFKKQALDNLKKAEDFLESNARNKDVISLEGGKLQYKVEQKGTGVEIQPHFSPLINYKGKYLDGSVFGASKESEMISLDETIPGFTKGLVGMKEGEKRTLYIHPDYGYGASGYLPPNSLLTFEIEVVKANAVTAPEERLSTTPSKDKNSGEVALPDLSIQAVR